MSGINDVSLLPESPKKSSDPRRQLLRSKSVKSQWTRYHISAFSITFVSYALFHATRKTFSNVKISMSQEWSPFNKTYPGIYDYKQWNSHNLFKSPKSASVFLGSLDTTFMISYSVGLYISGALGDRFNPRKVLALGMCSSSVMVFMFGTLSEWLHIYNFYWYAVFWALTGLLQSSGWPTVVAIVGNWFGKSSRGLVMGVWGSSPSVGNIVGACIASAVLHYGYEYAFLVPAVMTFCGGIIVYFSIIASPREVGLPEPEETDTPENDKEPLLSPESEELINDSIEEEKREYIPRPKAISFVRAFLLPGVLPYSLAYACLKLVNYSFFFWLPFYLQSAYHWEEAEADSLSIWYDVGSIVGSILGGIVSDKIGSRSPVVGILLLLSPGSLYIYYGSPSDKVVNALLMSLTGFFIGGASNLISTAISADLGRQKEFSGNKEALSTVTGIIDGTGSAGAAIGQILVPLIQNGLGWQKVFYLFMIMMIMTLICIIKIVYYDTKKLFQRCCQRWRRNQT